MLVFSKIIPLSRLSVGTVIDELGVPIPNASLEIERDSYLLIKTDENGQFSYNTFVDEGQADIFDIDITIVFLN